MKFIKQLILILGLFSLLIQTSWGVPLAGHVILTKGSVTAVMENGDSRALKRRSEIFNGDTIKTGPAGSVQIRFVDKALMTIKANSEMNIERYLQAQAADGQNKEQVIMSLVKGGFRTITGTIGKGDKSAYKVNTPAASIGIRGTNYEVQQEADGGFVMGVYSGGIQVENESGTIELGEGADFNYTRVKPKSSPKGLLAPPAALGENSATEKSEDETDSEESSDVSESQEESDDVDDVAENEGSQDSKPSNTSNTPNVVADIGADANKAIESKLENKINKSTAELIASGGTNSDIVNELIAAGILNQGETLDDLDPALFELVEKWLDAPFFDLIAALQALIAENVVSLFDFTDPFKDIDTTDTTKPFADTVITDQQFALAETGKLALLAIPVNSSNNYAGNSPSLSTLEAQLVSPGTVSSSGHDFISQNGHFRISYEVYNLTTKQTDRYEIEVVVDAATGGNGDLITFIGNAFEGSTYRKNDQNITGAPPQHFDYIFNAATQKYEFKPITGDSDNFILEMELNFDDDSNSSAATLALQQELGSNATFNRDDWYAESGLDMIIGNGAWDTTNNKPILVMRDKHSYQNQDGTTVTDERIEVVTKPIEADATTGGLLSFGNCVKQTKNCDIQVDNVAAGDNIRWGAWLAEVGEGIQLNSFKVNDSTLEFQQEEDILAFWIAAERADINQLIGNATFSANSACTDFKQCIGFADDGIVQSLTAQFDVNFTSGAITNGNLTLQTSNNPTVGVTSVTPGDVLSTWNVNFSGQMSSNDDGTVKLPEFQTQSLSGSVVETTGSSTAIIGNIGGIFVKPGDKFAGGYNLGTADGTNKHTAGVFSMEKQ
ncbi:MAG: hypothetical protein ACI8SR_001821 [Oceanicoccus sp.]|jgi:hypothetical protein